MFIQLILICITCTSSCRSRSRFTMILCKYEFQDFHIIAVFHLYFSQHPSFVRTQVCTFNLSVCLKSQLKKIYKQGFDTFQNSIIFLTNEIFVNFLILYQNVYTFAVNVCTVIYLVLLPGLKSSSIQNNDNLVKKCFHFSQTS